MNYKNFFLLHKEQWIFLIFMIFALLLVWRVYQGFFLAIDSSLDMQWYPAMQYWGMQGSKINPYIAYLNNDTFMSQAPNYTPMLYVLMYPFALMSFEWAKITFFVLSILCFLATLWVLYRQKVPVIFLLCMGILVILGYSFLNTLGNAQITIILGCLTAIAYAYRKQSWILILCLSLILLKYSFGAPILLAFFLIGYRKEVILAGAIQFIFVVLFAYEFDISIIQSLLSPLEVSKTATNIGPADLMSVSRILFDNNLFAFSNPFLWLIAIIYSVYIFICIWLRPPSHQVIASSILLSLGTIYHLGYDHYMFFIAICMAQNCVKRIDITMIFLIGLALFFWFGNRALKFFSLGADYNWAMNMGVTFTSIMAVIVIALAMVILKKKKLVA